MSNPTLQHRLDEAYEALYAGDLQAARRHLDDARLLQSKTREDNPDVALLEVDLLAEEGLLEEAVAAVEEAKEKYKGNMVVAFKFATLLLDIFDDVIEARPVLEDIAARLEKGESPNVDVDDADQESAAGSFALEVLLTLSDCRAADGDPQGALAAAEAAIALDAEDAMARMCKAGALFELCDLNAALAMIDEALKLDPKQADAYWLRGRILTATGDDAGAERAFERACSLDSERFRMPSTISKEAFEQVMRESLDELPPKVRGYLKNVAILLEDVPAIAVCKEGGFGPGLLGLHDGTPPSKAQSHDPWSQTPNHIVLYKRNIELAATDDDDLRDLIATTLLHEVLHYLGLDEEEVAERGLA